MKIKLSRRCNSLLMAAAVASLSALGMTHQAAAQFAVQGQDGHAHDASNRVGSNGYNGVRPGGNGISGNDITYGNVTGGRAFHGPLLERDPRAFVGPSPGGGLDSFVRQSAGAPTDYGAVPQYSWQPQVFYGDTRLVAPPTGALPIGFNGGYTSLTPSNFSNGFNTAAYFDGLQTRTLSRENMLLTQMLNSSNFDPTANPFNQTGTLNFVPVYGLNTPSNGIDSFNTPGLPDHQVGDASILRMRQELRDAAIPGARPPLQSDTKQPIDPNGPLNQPLNKPFEAIGDPIQGALNQSAGSAPLPASGITSMRAARLMVPPEQQSTLLDTLQKQMDASSDVARALADVRANSPQPTNNPAQAKKDTTNPRTSLPAGSKPIKAKSLAEGIKAKGLHDLMASAEDLIRDGKYDQARDIYNSAQRVAPNNPLIQLGRANAELAGGYYERAEQDLRVALRISPTLMLMQLELNAILPRERIAFLHKDLAELAGKEPKSERPWFLLAYLDYQTGDAASAESNLTEAEKRSGPVDSILIKRLKMVWDLPSKSSKPAPAIVTPPAPR